jgi:CheY-like chemotaxis protein
VPQYHPPHSTQLILIGEDDLDDQEFLKDIFTSIDGSYQLQFIPNGIEILHELSQRGDGDLPCLILLDYNMPGMTGLEILRELKTHGRYAKIPKIIWSTSRSAADKDVCIQLGAVDYLIKPSTVRELTEICKYMLSTCISAS